MLVLLLLLPLRLSLLVLVLLEDGGKELFFAVWGRGPGAAAATVDAGLEDDVAAAVTEVDTEVASILDTVLLGSLSV